MQQHSDCEWETDLAYRNSIGVTLVTSRSPPLAAKLELRVFDAVRKWKYDAGPQRTNEVVELKFDTR
jgi:hypothetical protein